MSLARVTSKAGAGALLVVSVSACRGRQSALDPAGPYANLISDLWWFYFAVCAVVYGLVVFFLLAATFRRQRERNASSERRLGIAVAAAVAATVITLFVLLFSSTSTGNTLNVTNGKQPVMIRIAAQQWWWEARYEDVDPSKQFTTANEIYIPVGRPVNLVLESRDVIHSLWIPNLHGKRDLIPGHTSNFYVQADRPGTYEGQCAEFCGHQHAKMRISVTAVSEQEYAAWTDQQRKPAKPPSNAKELRGQHVFLSGSCPMCHAISGTPAGGRTAPDLTHIGSRRMIAANSVPNSIGHLAGWVIDPQTVKPGNYMPPNPLPGEDLDALIAYLRSLK